MAQFEAEDNQLRQVGDKPSTGPDGKFPVTPLFVQCRGFQQPKGTSQERQLRINLGL